MFGVREIGFAAPSGTVTAITAYSSQGELATAIPFRRAGQGFTVGNWLRPGQAGLPRVTRRIGAGAGWSVTAYQGPWGRCLVTAGPRGESSDCLQGTAALGTRVFGWSAGPPQVVIGSAAAPVAHVVVRLSDGSAVRAGVISVGGQKYFAFATHGSARPVRWLAYNAARQGIGRGT